jgi:hypothetical protein
MARLLTATSFWKANMLQLKHMVGAGGAIQKPSENQSDCGTAPYHRFFLVRDEGAIGPNPPWSTGIMLRRGDRKKPSERRGPGPRHQTFFSSRLPLFPSSFNLWLPADVFIRCL